MDGAPLTLCTVVGGSSWIVTEHCPPEPLGDHETIVVRGPGTFTFVDEVGTRAEPIACGEHCAAPEEGGTRHRRGWSDSKDNGGTTLIVGSYPVRSAISRPLLDELPVVLRVGAGGTGDAVLDHLAAEASIDVPEAAGRAGPTAGLVAGVHAARVVRPARRRRGLFLRSPTAPGCRGRPLPSGSPIWSVNLRWPTSPAGA
ncbi:cupin domain-containing protein [Rhodococcus sp. SMB37]|uniref:cupin domain-containing protein n=1 Tax=Rhodococcus sp. SMB37 TaxID=2512213 RepID=UPI000AA69874|nr:cupin domain-containing protein [Rhodococcus sp. SMB37]